MKIGIIGGSGLYDISGFTLLKEEKIDTPYGDPSCSYVSYSFGEDQFIFISRHGKNHDTPPHKINYRANIEGFKTLNVDQIISISAVGAINEDYPPGDIVISSNAVDFTFCSRKQTFYEEDEVVHVDITEPFCPKLRLSIEKSFIEAGVERVNTQGNYICTNGPRLETAAEIRMFRKMEMDIVGMTLFPECALAREREICYAHVGISANFAAGITKAKLTVGEVTENVKNRTDDIVSMLKFLPKNITSNKSENCMCRNAVEGSRISIEKKTC